MKSQMILSFQMLTIQYFIGFGGNSSTVQLKIDTLKGALKNVRIFSPYFLEWLEGQQSGK